MITKTLLRAYSWMQARNPNVLWRGNPSRREIALTFDNGPHPRHTPGVLKVLNKHIIQATFSLIGRDVECHPNLERGFHEGGHQVGIHCHRHILFPFESPHVLRKHLNRARNVIAGSCGISPDVLQDVHPPYGLYTKKTGSLLAKWKDPS